MYEITAGYDPTRPMTQKQKSSPRFEWEPRVMGKVLYRGHKLVLSDGEYELNKNYLSVLAEEDVIIVTKVGADEQPKPAETVEVATAPSPEVLPVDASGPVGDSSGGEDSVPAVEVAPEVTAEVVPEAPVAVEPTPVIEPVETKMGRRGRRA